MQPPPHFDVMQGSWEHFPHQADIGVRGIGSTKEAAFERAADALTSVITDLGLVAPTQAVPIVCEAPDDELLLVDWLNALVYEMATRRMLFSRFTVCFNDHSLHATAWGEPIEVARQASSPRVLTDTNVLTNHPASAKCLFSPMLRPASPCVTRLMLTSFRFCHSAAPSVGSSSLVIVFCASRTCATPCFH